MQPFAAAAPSSLVELCHVAKLRENILEGDAALEDVRIGVPMGVHRAHKYLAIELLVLPEPGKFCTNERAVPDLFGEYDEL